MTVALVFAVFFAWAFLLAMVGWHLTIGRAEANRKLFASAMERQDRLLALLGEKQQEVERLMVTGAVVDYWHGCEREPAQG